MRTIVRGKNLEVPDRVRQYAERKFARLERLLDDRTDAIVELSNESHRSAADAHIADVTLVIDGKTLKQPRDRRVVPGRHRRGGGQGRAAGDRLQGEAPRPRPPRGGEGAPPQDRGRHRGRPRRERQIVKTKRFAIEPMFEEDAVAAMEDLGHDFYVFVNAENERVAVLYRRKDGDFGLIEPVVGGDYTPKQRSGRRAARRTRRVEPGPAIRRRAAPGAARVARYRPASRST